ncbi:Arginine biosynthesis bifunctional protein ArgJ [Caprobacter fermentans]|uniref:Arginine biosynthesis bifunctional protein ArgJ n=1 Tax=Caproicibacter fermentans TaxID=2576756 RepID=A0A6N8HZJ6_9FIRM|nr:bifunctional glutamate N-acetyltransferase/amino-acid acetyltransferase ArgJ [Caproicibacter fermentans]MVB11129.1 Arginine biosynthesis bifunctional protein ArgJ [Caproicibacter fermentans]OCN01773.1 bifunctional ornithine acetyltransferase/N-acetylglutamate synthase [Clostridium sp. W14A]QNK39295.1 bifunctional glutamate N-acetyltransferase/amino-acid acetyltransferase ArgJ [Caproicibacter fermentans]
MAIQFVEGGATAARGFTAWGMHCGIRRNTSKPDLAMICSAVPCSAAAVYTQNLVKGAPILVTKEHLKDGTARAVIVNSGNANTCNADGVEKAERMCRAAAKALGIREDDVIVASTGVIGVPLPIEPIENSVSQLASLLSKDGSLEAAKAIMTTDTVVKNLAVKCTLGGKTVRIGGIAKGSGMIHPNMGTMLCFVTTDAAVSAPVLDTALRAAVDKSFNMVSVDGDTSTNDTCAVMASGLAGNPELTKAEGEDYEIFAGALLELCTALARMLAKDGEGASRLLICTVTGAKDEENAKKAAKGVICSSLVKAAMFGADANWGRVLCAVGYCGAETDVGRVDVSFASKAGGLSVCENGAGIPFSEELAKKVLSEDEVTILVKLRDGDARATAFGCDLTYDYVKINGDYRT